MVDSRRAVAFIFLTALLDSVGFGIVIPVMPQAIGPNAQGELQGGAASLFSLSSIVGPPLFTQLFGHLSAPRC